MTITYYGAIDNETIINHNDTKTIQIKDKAFTIYLDKFIKNPPTEISNFSHIDVRLHIKINTARNRFNSISLDKFGKYQIGSNVYTSNVELIRIIEEYCPEIRFTRFEELKPLK